MEQLPRTLRTPGALGTPTIIRRLHNEVPDGFQGSFGGYYAFSSRSPLRPILTRGFGPPSVNTLLGEPLNIFAFASLGRGAATRYNYAMNTSLFDQVRQLSVEEQIELVEALWDNIVERNAVPGPTEPQKAELDRRLSEHAAHPDDVVPWSEVKDSALTRIRR
jgi:putative addiction module component (TIGR02574 family)